MKFVDMEINVLKISEFSEKTEFLSRKYFLSISWE